MLYFTDNEIVMSYGQVIKMHRYVYNTPNEGVLIDLETGTQYTFRRESYTGETRKWNVKLYDVVSFTADGSTATDVTLVRKHLKGRVYSYIPS